MWYHVKYGWIGMMVFSHQMMMMMMMIEFVEG